MSKPSSAATSADALVQGLVRLAFLVLLFAAWPATAEAAACPCSLPANQTCPSACGSCVTQPVSCTCETGCTSGTCPSGYQVVSSSTCFPNIFQSDYDCRRFGTQTLSQCATCGPGRWGSLCQECPGGAANPCNGNGTCSQGISGNGTCACFAGFAGPACQYSRAVTCNGHGTPNFNGTCSCDAGFTGPACNSCAPDHHGYPTCRFCSPAVTCSGHGSCSATGNCLCSGGFDGPACGTCAIGYFDYPTCRFCNETTTCGGRGLCGATGFCECDEGYAGPGCETCAPDHYGFPDCAYCHSQATCSGHGTCNAAGFCVCDQGYSGQNCLACGVTSVEEVCNDGIDEDCDFASDCSDADCCTAGACAAGDTDGDAFAGCDCDDTDPQAWGTPGEVVDLLVSHGPSGKTPLAWSPPIDPGGDPLIYETLRFDDPGDFDSATVCLPDPDPTTPTSVDTAVPPSGTAYFYLVRARSACPLGAGPLGADSSGNPRTGTCP